jgi:hypothetical protein
VNPPPVPHAADEEVNEAPAHDDELLTGDPVPDGRYGCDEELCTSIMEKTWQELGYEMRTRLAIASDFQCPWITLSDACHSVDFTSHKSCFGIAIPNMGMNFCYSPCQPTSAAVVVSLDLNVKWTPTKAESNLVLVSRVAKTPTRSEQENGRRRLLWSP